MGMKIRNLRTVNTTGPGGDSLGPVAFSETDPWSPPEPGQQDRWIREDGRDTGPRWCWPQALAVLAVLAVLTFVGARWLVSPLFKGYPECDRDGPRLATAMEIFVRQNAGQNTFGPAEAELCDSSPGVSVRLIARAPQTAAAGLSASFEAGGCGPVTESGVAYSERACVLPTGERITVSNSSQGALRVVASHDF